VLRRSYRVVTYLLALVLVIIASSPVTPAQASSSSTKFAEPVYLPAIENAYQVLTQDFSDTFLRSVSETRFVSNYAALSIKLYQATDNDRYLRNATRAFNDVLDGWTTSPMEIGQNPRLNAALADFFNLEPLLITYQELRDQGLVSATQTAYLRYYADQFALFGLANNLIGDHNQILSRASGVALALQMFPEHPDQAKWKSYVDQVWNYWWPQRDLNEDAGTYNAIGLYELVQLATLLSQYPQTDREQEQSAPSSRPASALERVNQGKLQVSSGFTLGEERTLKDRGVGRMFARYRDQLSTMGAMAQYGDDYFANAWPIWVYDYEVAARFYNDSTYRGAAAQSFWFGVHNHPATATTPINNLSRLVEYYYMGQVLSLAPTQLRPTITHTRSEISTRNVPAPGRARTPDMLILAPSRAPASPFAMVELYARGFHAQLNRRGAIQFYSVGGIPLYHGMNRHNGSAVHGNITPILPPNESFPHPIVNTIPTEWSGPPDSWRRESIDPHALTPVSARHTDQVEISKFTLRLALPKQVASATLVIDNLRLVGPAGTKMLDDFENLDNWRRSDNPYALTRDATHGESALAIHLAAGADVFYVSDPLEVTFSTKDYTALEYDWKYLAPTNLGLSFIFRITQPSSDTDSQPGDVNAVPTIERAMVTDRGEDAYGQIVMSSYFTYDSAMVRKMVLTKEGMLIIQDTITPGVSANGYHAGPLWQLYTVGERGANWFDSPGEGHPWYRDNAVGSRVSDKSLLIYFGKARGRTSGCVQGPMVTQTKYVIQTAYAKQTLKAGQQVSFVTVLVPHDPGRSGAAVAEGISVRDQEQGTTVTIKVGGQTIRVWLERGGRWQVTRTEPGRNVKPA
jgi:hypothetical protein